MNPRKRLYSYVTQSRFLHVEDALEIGKVRLFVGEYRKGAGASALAFHYLDLADARVILSDLSWGKGVEFIDFKGTSNAEGPQSRVMKINSKGGKAWVQIDNGPGTIIGKGAIKPAGPPASSVSVPLTTWDARKLGHACLAYIAAWESANLLRLALSGPISAEIPDTETKDTPRPSPPDVFPSPGEAILWGVVAGEYADGDTAADDYYSLKANGKPADAHEMRRLWVDACNERAAGNVV